MTPPTYGGRQPEWDAPAINGAAVTLSDDTADPAGPFRGLWVANDGDLKVTHVGGSTATYKNISGGTLLPFAVSRVWSTGSTTAGTDLIGLK